MPGKLSRWLDWKGVALNDLLLISLSFGVLLFIVIGGLISLVS